MKKVYVLSLFFSGIFLSLDAQLPVVVSKNFSLGGYGRVGIARSDKIEFPRSLNLNGMGSIGGRFEEGDYVEMTSAFNFEPVSNGSDTTKIIIQSRFAFYTSQGQIIGNVNSNSYGGLTIALPELYAEAKNIMGSPWSIWVGARFFRGDDIHLIDHFYFDDHSSQGFGVKYNNTQFSIMFPGSVDSTSSLPPYFYTNIINGAPVLGLRNRAVYILEHIIPIKDGTVKLMAEYQRLASGTTSDTTTSTNYPADYGYVLGVKLRENIASRLPGSYFDASIRYGSGIANGGDGGGTKTFLTYGAPNFDTKKFRDAYSVAATTSVLYNISPNYSLNAYCVFTKSRGASDSLNKAADYRGRQLFNRKTDFSIGARGTWYIKNWFHLLHELDFASRTDGTQDAAQLFKFSIAPTLVPNGKRDVWSRPHFRLVYSVARYNKFAADNLYSPYLAQTGTKTWGQYFGVKTEWWF